MSLLFESIQIRDGQFLHLSLHQQRVVQSCDMLFPPQASVPNIALALQHIPIPAQGTHKCRVVYGPDIRCIQIEPYTPRIIRSLRLVFDDNIAYSHKFLDRSCLHNLYNQRHGCDDVLLIKQGYVTDTSYANVVLWNGSRWITPDTPLLPGIQRQTLLLQGNITTAPVLVEDLHRYSIIGLINAMNSLDTMNQVSIHNVLPATTQTHMSPCISS